MTLQELCRKIIPVTQNELKCALDRQMREQMRKEAAALIVKWHNEHPYPIVDGEFVPPKHYWVKTADGTTIGFLDQGDAKKYLDDKPTAKAI